MSIPHAITSRHGSTDARALERALEPIVGAAAAADAARRPDAQAHRIAVARVVVHLRGGRPPAAATDATPARRRAADAVMP